uniref:Trichohyalin-like n=1 Tax=Cacopsylla melanoneura TaxID=428564 RepID=A0A8D8RAD2_9HEMI
MKYHGHIRPHPRSLLTSCLLLWVTFAPLDADLPPQNSYYPAFGEAVTECKYRTAHSKHSWLMDLTLPYLLRDSVENKYRELFHNNTFIPYILRTPFTFALPNEETQTTDTPVGREHVESVLGKKIQQALNKVQKKAKDNVITKRYTLAEPYVSTKDNGEPISMSDWYPDRNKDENFGTAEQKGAMYKPKIQPKIWKGIVNARGLWENKSLVNGISDSFDPDYELHDDANPFPNGDFTDGGAYDSEIPMLKNRSMCPNILFITLGPGEHPINNPVYMDSDYNFRDIPNFNGTWKFPDSRPASDESKLEPQDALARAKYMNEVFNKTREHEKIMNEYPKDRWKNKEYLLKRKKRNVLNGTKHEDNKEDVNEGNDIKLEGADRKEDGRNSFEQHTHAKEARKQDEKKIRDLIDEEIMARALHEKRLKNSGKPKEDQLKDNLGNNFKNVFNQEKGGNTADRNNPDNAEKDRLKPTDVNHERTNAKTNIQNSEDYENMDTKKITHHNTEFNYDIDTYKELTPVFRNIARDNYEDMLKTEEIRRYMNHGKEKPVVTNDEDLEARDNYENLLKTEEIRRYGNEDKKKHEVTKDGDLENEDSAISTHANLDSSTEDETAKPQYPKVDFLSFVEPVNEPQEHLNVPEHNETISCDQPKQNNREDSKPLEENKTEGTTENDVPNKFTNKQTTEQFQHDETKVNDEKQEVTNNKDEEYETTAIPEQDVTNNREKINMEREHETTTANEKREVTNTNEENKTEKEYNKKEEEQNSMMKEGKNKERKQNEMENKQTTPNTFYESPELDSYREPAKDYKTTEDKEGQTYEAYHHESQYTEPPPQKDRLDSEDVRKDYKGPKKPRLDENKVVEMIKMTQLRKEYEESNKRVRTTPKQDNLYAKQDKLEKKDENEGKIDGENSKAKVNKFKYMITEMRKKFNYIREGKAKQVEDEATKKQKERKERIELMKEYYKTKFKTLKGETKKKVKDYPDIENTEEMAGFPVDWYRKYKDKVRTRKEIELEDIEEDLDREERDRMANSRKKRDMGNEKLMPKSRKKRSTKIMLRKNNQTYVISTKHLNLFRRKNVKIYLNHEHVRKFDNRRKKRHVADKIDEGFDSENEFNGKYIQERTGSKNEINLDSFDDSKRDIKGNDPENDPIYLDSQDLEIRHIDDKTEPHGIELRAEDIVDMNYIDPRERKDTHTDTKDLDDSTRQISKHEDPNIKNNFKDHSIDIKQIDKWVNMETNEIETWLSSNRTNAKDDIEELNTPDIDSVDMHESELVAESDDEMKSRVKRDADFVYVTRPKRGWKKHIKDKIREIKAKLSTKFKDRIYEWTTKHKWETLPDEKDRTTPTLMKKRFLNIKKISQLI